MTTQGCPLTPRMIYHNCRKPVVVLIGGLLLRSGHQSFSNSRKINDLVGNIVHSSILVPYHGWRISHRTHHSNHGHVENDESWHPVTKSIYDKMVRCCALKHACRLFWASSIAFNYSACGRAALLLQRIIVKSISSCCNIFPALAELLHSVLLVLFFVHGGWWKDQSDSGLLPASPAL